MRNWLHNIMDPEARFSPVTNPGSPVKDEKMLKMVDGHFELVKVGESSLYDQIQSHKDSVDIYKILDRYRNGDIDALTAVHGEYMDITDAPKTLAEAYTFVNNSEKFFESLPLDLRREYDHDASKFIADIGTEHFKVLLAKTFRSSDPVMDPVPVTEPVKEVNTDA